MLMPLGQLTSLPPRLAENPFYQLQVQFARYKMGSFELLFEIESFLIRYSWLALLLLFALVLPPLEEVDVISTIVRLSTLIYPFFFIWSITRLSGVELMQLVLEGQWTTEVLASSAESPDLATGFIDPLWMVVRQYWLITTFSLILYSIESHVFVRDEFGRLILDDLVADTLFYLVMYFNVIAWIVFVYLARLYTEVRLRNGLIKGLATLIILLGGLLIFAGYCLLFLRFGYLANDPPMIAFIFVLSMALVALSYGLNQKMARNFRNYLLGQMDIDVMIYDDVDPQASAWSTVSPKPRSAESTPV